MKNVSLDVQESSVDYLLRVRRRASRRYCLQVFLVKYLLSFLLFLFNSNLILRLLLPVVWLLFSSIFLDHRDIFLFDPSIRIWFGVPGSGKTSMAALLTRFSRKLKIDVLSNVQISGALKYEPTDLGKYDMSFDGLGCHVILDEATLSGLDNRLYKDFVKTDLPVYFSIHRHMFNRVDVFSQGYDLDKRVRDRASSSGLFYLIKLPVSGFLCYRRIRRVLFINKDDKQMIDGFEFRGLPKIIRSKSVWNSFDTLDKSLCPQKRKEFVPW